MQIPSRFTIATHMLIIIALKGKESKVTSDFLAASVGVNPVIIRKTLSQLKKAELISVARGTGGTEIVRILRTLVFLDVYQAVECLGKLVNSSVSMIIRIQIVQLERIFMMFWIKNWREFSWLWRLNLVRLV